MRVTLRRICPGEEYIFVPNPDWTLMGGMYDTRSGDRVRITGYGRQSRAMPGAAMDDEIIFMYPVLFLPAGDFEGYVYAEELRPIVTDCGLD